MIRFLDLAGQYRSIQAEIDNAIATVIGESSFVGGRHVRQFEEAFAEYQQVSHCVGVGNGTDALEICIEALDLKPGSEIIVPATTFVASAEAVTRSGHKVVFADVNDDARIVKEEQFGLALPILKYSSVDDAVCRANNSKYGLGGSVWGPDAEKAAEVALELESGMSWVNQHLSGNEQAPFGGVKSSGVGREGGGIIGLSEFVETKSLYVRKLKSSL